MEEKQRKVHQGYKSELYRSQLQHRMTSVLVHLFEQFEWKTRLFFQTNFVLSKEASSTLLKKNEKTNTFVYKLSLSGCNHHVVAKFFPLRTWIPDIKLAFNHEIEFNYLKMFAILVELFICPHFVILYGIDLPLNTPSLLKETQPNLKEMQFVCLLAEHEDASLHHLLFTKELSEHTLMSLILQVLLTLHIIQTLFPSFRHNDCHLGNILIQCLSGQQNTYTKYIIFDLDFYIHNSQCPFRCLLWDMYFASIAKKDCHGIYKLVPYDNRISKVPESKSIPNRYFDVWKFFVHLDATLKHKTCKTKYYENVRRLIDNFVPTTIKDTEYENKNEPSLYEQELATAEDVLSSPFFASFRQEPTDLNILQTYRLTPSQVERFFTRLNGEQEKQKHD